MTDNPAFPPLPGPRPGPSVSARRPSTHLPDEIRRRMEAREEAVRSPYRGITTGGEIRPGLFSIEQTGVSTQPILAAARTLADALGEEERAALTFPLDSDAWRRWSNVHRFLMRHGVCLDDLDVRQRETALGLLRATLSEEGFWTARGIMQLNHTLGELTGRLVEEYDEWLYWLSLFGSPDEAEPWGWQLDGHHLNLSCLVLGDQLVLSPMFMGSEPTYALNGEYAFTRVFDGEEQRGLALMQSLSPDQQAKAVIGTSLPGEVLGAGFRDNFELRYEGIRYGELSTAQQASLLDLIQVYVGRIRPGHAEVKLAEVRRHLAETYFAWIGDTDDSAVFYYRIHSPIILIEFDHMAGIGLANDEPARSHIHTVVRTPNGNDYGKDLLRQHYQQYDHRPGGGHV